jgi:tetratricopeptide (TPR) repeat protein
MASQHALEIRRRVGTPAQVARSLEHIASTQLQLGRLEEAQHGLLQVLDLRDDLGDRAGLATAWGNMGMVHAARQEYDSAIAAWRTALEHAEQTGQRPYIPVFLNNIGEAYLEMGSFALAQTALSDARSITEEIGDLGSLADILRNQGALAFRRGDAESGLELVDQAIALCRQVGSGHALAQSLRTRGEILGDALFEADHTPSGEFGNSDTCFRKAETLFEEIGDIIALERTLRVHASVMERRGNLEASDTLLDRADALRTQHS